MTPNIFCTLKYSNVEKHPIAACCETWNLETVDACPMFCVNGFRCSASKDCALYFLCALASDEINEGNGLGSGKGVFCRQWCKASYGDGLIWLVFVGDTRISGKKNLVFFCWILLAFQLWKSIVCLSSKPSPIITDIRMMWFSCFAPIALFHHPPSTPKLHIP